MNFSFRYSEIVMRCHVVGALWLMYHFRSSFSVESKIFHFMMEPSQARDDIITKFFFILLLLRCRQKAQ